MTVTVDEFEVADAGDAWTQDGFSVDSDTVCRIGAVRIRQAREKINRIRGQVAFLPDGAPLPEVKQTAAIDRWSRGLGIVAISLLVLTLLVYGGSLIALISGASQIG